MPMPQFRKSTKVSPDPRTVAALVVALTCGWRCATALGSDGVAFQTSRASPQRTADSGRVVATITALEGAVRIPGVDVELLALDGNVVLARTLTDGAGQAAFPDVPVGRYVVKATRPGFVPTDSAPFDVRAGETAQVLADIRLTFVAPSVEVRAPTSPTQSVQPVSASDMLAGSVLDIAPLEGDDFQRLLPLLPGVVRGPDGRLRAKGGQPTQGALQISSTSLIDPSSGDFDLELPGQSLESVEMLATPFAAEYGRFSLVGRRRVSGLRRRAEPGRPPSTRAHGRHLPLASLACREVPVPRRTAGLQHSRRVGRT